VDEQERCTSARLVDEQRCWNQRRLRTCVCRIVHTNDLLHCSQETGLLRHGYDILQQQRGQAKQAQVARDIGHGRDDDARSQSGVDREQPQPERKERARDRGAPYYRRPLCSRTEHNLRRAAQAQASWVVQH
jgi:hypothetical protein